MKKIWKKICPLLCLACLLCSVVIPACAVDVPELSFVLTADGKSDVTVDTGDTVTVFFSVKRSDGNEPYHLNALDNDIEYDSSFFMPVGEVTMLRGGHATGSYDRRLVNDQPIVRVSDMVCEYGNEEMICSFTLKVLGMSGSSSLRCSEELAYDANGNPISVSANKLTVRVQKTPPVINPPATDPEEGAFVNPYVDVSEDAWYYDGVMFATKMGWVSGVGGNRFAPDGFLTRAMMVTCLYRMEGCPAVDGKGTYDDVLPGQWYTDAVNWADTVGLVKGYGNGRFGSQDLITREQLAVLLFRYTAYCGADTSARADLGKFTDSDSISVWAAESLQWANAKGLVNGKTETTIAPGDSASRAEMATLLMRVFENVLKGFKMNY